VEEFQKTLELRVQSFSFIKAFEGWVCSNQVLFNLDNLVEIYKTFHVLQGKKLGGQLDSFLKACNIDHRWISWSSEGFQSAKKAMRNKVISKTLYKRPSFASILCRYKVINICLNPCFCSFPELFIWEKWNYISFPHFYITFFFVYFLHKLIRKSPLSFYCLCNLTHDKISLIFA